MSHTSNKPVLNFDNAFCYCMKSAIWSLSELVLVEFLFFESTCTLVDEVKHLQAVVKYPT